jgi:hypothetical protein
MTTKISMVKLSKILMIAFFACSFLVGCSGGTSDATPTNTDPKCEKPILDAKNARTKIIGTWKWIQTETSSRGGISISNPTSEGKTQGLNFKENSVDELVNGSVISSYGYEIEATSGTGQLTMTYTNTNGDVIRTYDLSFCSGSMKITPTNVSINVTHLYNK